MNHNHNDMMMNMAPQPTNMNMTTMPRKHGMMMHMSFYWGHSAIVLFPRWPGASAGMYALSLILVFVLAFLTELVSRARVGKSNNGYGSSVALTILHGLRVGLAYMVMLAVMSFNVGVFIVAVLGHALGFLVFGTRVFGLGRSGDDTTGLPEMSC
ncbi:hypothetical protein vseg_013116 [Gypsophila vaccaria]